MRTDRRERRLKVANGSRACQAVPSPEIKSTHAQASITLPLRIRGNRPAGNTQGSGLNDWGPRPCPYRILAIPRRGSKVGIRRLLLSAHSRSMLRGLRRCNPFPFFIEGAKTGFGLSELVAQSRETVPVTRYF